MNTFEASNGARFSEKENGTLVFNGGILDYPFELSPGVVYGLREFFQHERDEELGRWRWPENPDYVVYRSDFDQTYLYVLNEATADVFGLNGIEGYPHDEAVDDELAILAAEAFRAVHPERKPWEDAVEGEAWVITYEDHEYPAIFQAGLFRDHRGAWEPRVLTAARRIWPESD